jgi:hypothetical protein
MGMFRDSSIQEIDLVKEMAEGLGSTGLRLDEVLQNARDARLQAEELLVGHRSSGNSRPAVTVEQVNESIAAYNALVDEAERVLRSLLIQREACGFRTHRHVERYYPIPARLRVLKA